MIVYFFKKSKADLVRWGIGVGVLCLLLYLIYVWSNILKHEHKTIQIVRSGEQKELSIEAEKPSDQTGVEKGDFTFVSSSKGKYYYPINCRRAQALSVKNMLYFKDKMSAEKAGFVEYKGC